MWAAGEKASAPTTLNTCCDVEMLLRFIATKVIHFDCLYWVVLCVCVCVMVTKEKEQN